MKKFISGLLVVALFCVQSAAFSQEQCQSMDGSGRLINAETGTVIADFGEGSFYGCIDKNNRERVGFAFSNQKIQFATKWFNTGRVIKIKNEEYPATNYDYFVQDAGFCVTLDNRKTAYCAYPHP